MARPTPEQRERFAGVEPPPPPPKEEPDLWHALREMQSEHRMDVDTLLECIAKIAEHIDTPLSSRRFGRTLEDEIQFIVGKYKLAKGR